MQDGATAHTCESTLEYLKLYVNVLDEWPSMSPDLNPIENLWAIMKAKVSEIGPTTIEDLISVIFDVWNSISMTTISNLIDSMPRRLKKVLKSEGNPIDY